MKTLLFGFSLFFQISPDLEISQCEEAHIVTVPEEDLNQLSSKLTSELVLTFQILFTKHISGFGLYRNVENE